MTFPSEARRWRCGICKTWNKIEARRCVCCKSDTMHADMFQSRRELTQAEEAFFTQTAPRLLVELREIKVYLKEILDEFKRARKGSGGGT